MADMFVHCQDVEHAKNTMDIVISNTLLRVHPESTVYLQKLHVQSTHELHVRANFVLHTSFMQKKLSWQSSLQDKSGLISHRVAPSAHIIIITLLCLALGSLYTIAVINPMCITAGCLGSSAANNQHPYS